VKTEAKKVIEYLSLLLILCYQFASLAYQGKCTSFDLPFLADISVEDLFLLFASLAKFSSSCALALLTPSLHKHIFFPGHLSLLPLPVHFLLAI